MEARTRGIISTLVVCLIASTVVAIFKILYGNSTYTLSFVADGIHSLFDSCSTLIGIFSIYSSSKPPDAGHPYGHQKFETMATLALGILLLLAAYQVGSLAYERIAHPDLFPTYSFYGLIILGVTMLVNVGISRFESKAAKKYQSKFLASDSIHNLSDFWITIAVFISLISVRFHIPYIDSAASIAITFYLIYLAFSIVKENLQPLVDQSVLDTKAVEDIVYTVKDVLYCHHIRSRGESNFYFLDLHIHLPKDMPLEKAHDISHEVESRLKSAFPGLKDVVIHMEPHEHEPCAKEEF